MLKNPKPLYIVCVLIFLNIFLLSAIRFFPYPEIFVYPYLRNLGLLPYKEIIDQHFPGLFFLPINFASLGITSIERARVLQIGLISLNHLLIYIFFKRSNEVFRYRYLYANALYAIWSVVMDGHILWIDSIISTLILGSLVLLQRKSMQKIFTAFFLMGIAIVFKQSVIIFPLITLVNLTKQYRFKYLVLFAVTTLIPLLCALIYLCRIGVINEFVYWTIIFNRDVYASLALKVPSTYQLVVLAPIVIIGFYVTVKNIVARNNILISSYFVGSLIFAYPRFELIHLSLCVTLGIIIIVQYFNNYNYFHILGLTLIMIGTMIYFRNYKFIKVNTPFIEDGVIYEINNLTENGAEIYAYSIDPRIYSLTNTVPVLPFFVHLPWYLVELEDQMVVSLSNSKPRLVVRDTEAILDGHQIDENTTSIDSYVEENYRVVYTNGSIEILEKNE